MNKLIREALKIDLALEPQEIAAAGDETTNYFGMANHRRALFVVQAVYGLAIGDILLEGEEVVLTLREATAAAGTAAQDLEDAEVAGGVHATQAVIGTEGHQAADDVTINGVVFERTGAGYDAAARPLEWNSRDQLITAINGQFDNIVADDDGAHVVILDVVEPGTDTITLETDLTGADSYGGTTQFVALAEVKPGELSSGYTHVALQIENDSVAGDGDFAAVCLRGDGRYTPGQAVAVALP